MSRDNLILQPQVSMIYAGDYVIELLINSRTVSFSYDHRWRDVATTIQQCLNNGWNNAAVTVAVKSASRIDFIGSKLFLPPWNQKETEMKYDSKQTPDKEYRFTAIATNAKVMTYRGQRQWFKTVDEAKRFCADVLEVEHNNGRRFGLTIVEAVEEVTPKSQIQLNSTSFRE